MLPTEPGDQKVAARPRTVVLSSQAWGMVPSLACSVLLLGGCYQRTVSASGLGNRSVDIEEPYQEAWPIEPAVRGIQRAGEEPARNQRSGVGVFKGGTD